MMNKYIYSPNRFFVIDPWNKFFGFPSISFLFKRYSNHFDLMNESFAKHKKSRHMNLKIIHDRFGVFTSVAYNFIRKIFHQFKKKVRFSSSFATSAVYFIDFH